jgi:hypothetical protein
MWTHRGTQFEDDGFGKFLKYVVLPVLVVALVWCIVTGHMTSF